MIHDCGALLDLVEALAKVRVHVAQLADVLLDRILFHLGELSRLLALDPAQLLQQDGVLAHNLVVLAAGELLPQLVAAARLLLVPKLRGEDRGQLFRHFAK